MSPIDSILGIDGLVVQSVKHAQHTRQGNELMVLHLAVPKYHYTHCNRYFRHQFPGIRPRLRSTEAYRLEVFEAHDGGVSQRKLTLTHHIGSAMVERWYQSFVKQRFRSSRAERALGAGYRLLPRASTLKWKCSRAVRMGSGILRITA